MTDCLREPTSELNLLSSDVIGAAIEVHRTLGPGLLESTYLECLCAELELRRVEYQREVALPLKYKGRTLDCGHRIDLIVGHRVIVELKTVDKIMPIHQAQILTYLRLKHLQLGLLINFNTATLHSGLRRVVNAV